ncbi:MAG: ATP-binding protein [Deltaproteobacteria bacterium]|nr:ATP-binding protein [Deltaproteobacteria bacterium]
MRDFSLHIMDVAENGLDAGANLIRITVKEEHDEDRLLITIADNGRGIPKEKIDQILDPFYTTRTTRRVGLGLSLFREASRRCDGDFKVNSEVGLGTEVTATFQLSHIDLPPMGDMAGTMAALIAGNPDADFVYTHEVDGNRFELDTREIREELEDVPLHHPEVIRYVTQTIREFLSAG